MAEFVAELVEVFENGTYYVGLQYPVGLLVLGTGETLEEAHQKAEENSR